MFFFLMIRRPPRSTLDRSSAASDVYKRQVVLNAELGTGRIHALQLLQFLVEGFTYDLAPFLPVSYTHLRAHETVLDLVCRLLLDKNIYHRFTSAHGLLLSHVPNDLRRYVLNADPST